jgi:uncharacterized protein (TIGR02284 family)
MHSWNYLDESCLKPDINITFKNILVMNKEKIRKEIQDIVDICKDGATRYETASKNIEYEDLKTLFLRLSQQRRLFISVLRNEALRLGIDLNTSGTLKGFFQRNWLTTKAVFSQDTNENVIEESVASEKAALETYDRVLGDAALPEYLYDTLLEQRKLIKIVVSQLSELERIVVS